MTQNVRRDVGQTRGRRVAPQVRVERRVRDGEDELSVPHPMTCGIGRVEHREPGRLRQLSAPDPTALGAHFVQDNPVRRSVQAKLDKLGPPQARQDCGQDHRPIEQPRVRVRDHRQQPAHLVGREPARQWTTSYRSPDVGRRVLLDRAHPPGEVVEG